MTANRSGVGGDNRQLDDLYPLRSLPGQCSGACHNGRIALQKSLAPADITEMAMASPDGGRRRAAEAESLRWGVPRGGVVWKLW